MRDLLDPSCAKDFTPENPSYYGVAFAYMYCPKTGRVLVQHRIIDSCWGIPGGCMDEGEEDPALAVIREVDEETGIHLDKGDLVLLTSFHCASKDRNGTVFYVEVDSDRSVFIKDEESHQLQWVEPQNWPEPMHPSMLKSIKKFMHHTGHDIRPATSAQPQTASPA